MRVSFIVFFLLSTSFIYADNFSDDNATKNFREAFRKAQAPTEDQAKKLNVNMILHSAISVSVKKQDKWVLYPEYYPDVLLSFNLSAQKGNTYVVHIQNKRDDGTDGVYRYFDLLPEGLYAKDGHLFLSSERLNLRVTADLKWIGEFMSDVEDTRKPTCQGESTSLSHRETINSAPTPIFYKGEPAIADPNRCAITYAVELD